MGSEFRWEIYLIILMTKSDTLARSLGQRDGAKGSRVGGGVLAAETAKIDDRVLEQRKASLTQAVF